MARKKLERQFEITAFCSAIPFSWNSDFVFHGESHDFWEIVFVMDGQVEVTEDEKVYRLEKNDMILHAPMEFHRIRSAGGTAPRGFVMSFAATGQLPDALREGCFVLGAEEAEEYEALSRRVYDFFKGINDSPFAGQEAGQALSSFLIRLGSNARPRLRLDSSRGAAEYKHAVSTMSAFIRSNSSLVQIADACNISVSYLKLLFRKYAGISPKRYYANLRMQYAISRLRDGLTSAEIAAEMSFSSAGYFSTFFQRQMGVSPSEYRQKRERNG